MRFEPRGASNVYRIDPRGLGALRVWLDHYWSVGLDNYATLLADGDRDAK